MRPSRLTSSPHSKNEGFSLLELLIVISILVILSATLIFILNPAETLRKSRDAQRLSDLNSLKNSLGLYLTSTSTPYLAGSASNDACKTGASYVSGDKIYYSYPSNSPGTSINDSTLDGGSASVPSTGQVTRANLRKTDATGWVPVDLANLRGGSPIASIPIDPTNTIASTDTVAVTDLVYRYACDATDTTFEINANLESLSFTVDPDNREKDDGGNNDNLYEVGTKLTILGAGTDF